MPLLEPRRMLDGGEDGTLLQSISDGLLELRDSVSNAFDGVTNDHVASGAVDPTTLNRKERAALAVDGEVPGFFGVNPWNVGLDFDLGLTAFIAAHGGAALLISANASTFDTLQSKVFAPRFAFLWDDQVIAQQGVLELAVTDQTFLVAQIGPPRGQRLTLWVTEPDITFSILRQETPDKANALRKEAFGAVGAGSGSPIDTVKGFLSGLFDFEKNAVLFAIVVGGVVLYFVAKGELDGMRAGGG